MSTITTAQVDDSPASVKRGESTENKSFSISNWLTNSWNYFSTWFSKDSNKHNYKYPTKERRYSRLWWNAGYQYCYTDQEIKLIDLLSQKYLEIFGTPEKNPFQLSVEKKFYDWWTCAQPLVKPAHQFTLPNREAKDATVFPLWHFADSLAKQIANWQGERLKNQNPDLMNDPTMIILDHLKELFYSDLTETGCKHVELKKLTQIQSYVKQIAHLVPKFGPDTSHLLDIQKHLKLANNIVQNCIAQKQLPELLSDIITKTTDLENTLGTYLHFLLIDEEVAENFSFEFTEDRPENYRLSPVSKAYQNVYDNKHPGTQTALVPLQALNKFYELQPIENNGDTTVKLHLKENALDNIKFANFVTQENKQDYLAALATLESFIHVRKTLEEFKSIQSTIGTINFATGYLQNTHSLGENFLSLIDQTFSRMDSLISAADEVLEKNSEHSNTSPGISNFEKNLEALDNHFAKDSTTLKQLETICLQAKSSMEAYQAEMRRLAVSLQNGQAQQEVGESMQKLMVQINHINQLLNAQLNKKEFLLKDAVLPALSSEPANECVNDNHCHVTFEESTDEPTQQLIVSKEEHPESHGEAEGQCQTETANWIYNIYQSALQGSLHGFIRGTSNLIADLLKTKNWSAKSVNYLSQLSYYGLLFSYQFVSHHTEEQDDPTPWVNAAIHAAYMTGQTWFLNAAINYITDRLNQWAKSLKQNEHPTLAKGVKNMGAITKYGLFAFDAHSRGLPEASAALVAGTASQVAVETIGKKLIH